MEIGIFSNKKLLQGTTMSFLLMLIIIYVPFLSPIFNTFPLGLSDWQIIISFSIIPLLLGEGVKLVSRKL